MNTITSKKLMSIMTATAIMFTLGASAAEVEYTTSNDTSIPTISAKPQKYDMWSILTQEQKTSVLSGIKLQITQELADGLITQTQYDTMITSINNGQMPERTFKNDKEDIEQQNEKWTLLTDTQKQEVYKIYNENIQTQIEMIDKYVELGVMDTAEAQIMKSNLQEKQSNTITSGNMPMFGKGGKIKK